MLQEDIDADKLNLPKKYPGNVKKAFVNAIAMAHSALVYTRSYAGNCCNERVRLATKVNALENEVYKLREEIAILHERFSRIPPHQRPRYQPK